MRGEGRDAEAAAAGQAGRAAAATGIGEPGMRVAGVMIFFIITMIITNPPIVTRGDLD